MTKTKEVKEKLKSGKKIVLFIGLRSARDFLLWRKENIIDYKIYSLASDTVDKQALKDAKDGFDKILFCNFSDDNDIAKVLAPYQKDIIAMTSRGEANLSYLKRCIPHLPYINTPTESSIKWSTDKIEMRQRMRTFDESLTPEFLLAKDAEQISVSEVEAELDYPVMVKPTGLASSMLVTNCYHRDELEDALARVHKQASIHHKKYKEFYKKDTPQVLVEELMEGEMYSIDGVVDGQGVITSYPPAHVKTGKQVGFDDYFGYRRLTPTRLNEKSLKTLKTLTKQAVISTGLRYTSFHLEVLRTEDGWKVIEIAPRIGGFRQEMYKLSYGIDLMFNDIENKRGRKINVSQELLGYTAVLQIFAKKEGVIKSITGLKKINNLASLHTLNKKKKNGDTAKFAKNGGSSVFNIILHHKDRSELLADMRRLEQNLKIVIA